MYEVPKESPNDGNPDPGSEPDGGPGLDFDFPLDLGDHPDAAAPAVTTYGLRHRTVAAPTHLLLWQADMIENSNKPNQGDADALRALAQTLTNLRNSLTP